MLVNIHKSMTLLLLASLSVLSAGGQSLGLEDCLNQANAHSKSMQLSRNQVAIGKERLQEVQAGFLPKVQGNVDYKYFTQLPYQLLPLSVFGGPAGQFREAQFGVPHNINAQLQLSMPLYNAQLVAAAQSARLGSEMAEVQHQKSSEQLYAEITVLYHNAQLLGHQMLLLDSNLLQAEQLLQQVRLMQSQGMARTTDVEQVRLQLAELQLQRQQAANAREQLLNVLTIAIGKPISDPLEVEPLPTTLPGRPTSQSATTSTELRLYQLKQQLAERELRSLRTSRWTPNLHLIAAYGTTGFGYDQQPNDFLRFYPIGFAGLQLQYPLFNGTATQRKINTKKLEVDNSRLQLALLSDQQTVQLQNAHLDRLLAEQSIQNRSEQLVLARNIDAQTRLRHGQGTASLTDLLLADQARRQAEQQHLAALVAVLKADLEIKRLQGQLQFKANPLP